EIVEMLRRYQRFIASARRDTVGAGDLPAIPVGAADVAHLAGADQIVHGAQRFLQWRERIGPMELVEVDEVGAEPLEALLAGLDQMLARQAALRHRIALRKEALGCEYEIVALEILQDGGEHPLGFAARIGVRRVDEIAAALDEGL